MLQITILHEMKRLTANLEKASTSALVDVALSIDLSTDLPFGLLTALSKDKE